MAKKNKTTTVTVAKEKRDMTKFCAFWSMALSAILYIASGVINFIKWFSKNIDQDVVATLGKVSGILLFVGNLALVIAIAIPSYSYVSRKAKGWKIFYWIALAIFVLGVVFNVLPAF